MRGFPKEEYQARVIRLQNKMQATNIDVTLITSAHNFRYFTGLDSYFWESPTRPWFLLIPQSQDPIAVIPSIGETALKKTWIKKINTWTSPQPEDEGISALKESIKNLIKDKGNIGCEIGKESQLRMSISDFDLLRKNLSNFNFVDISKIIWGLRMIKSQGEIKKIKKIISIASNVFDNLPNYLKIGMTEVEICNFFKQELLKKGADYTLYMSCASGQGGYDQIICDPSEKKLKNGDVLIIDTGTTLDGYFCDFDRNYGFGNIKKETNDAYAILWEAVEKAFEKAKPGFTCADISNTMNSFLHKSNLSSNSVGRMGHGLGLQLTEPPSIMNNDRTILEKNMILTIEPCYEYLPGKMLVIEENILITENSFELLTSRSPQILPIIN
ncbi:Xaa-Pro peptidase family protein [Alphaproteobacteria bacterium]|nr:Xaa-Pro peptidase family protein [Alphaproteobacteria bacterium]